MGKLIIIVVILIAAAIGAVLGFKKGFHEGEISENKKVAHFVLDRIHRNWLACSVAKSKGSPTTAIDSIERELYLIHQGIKTGYPKNILFTPDNILYPFSIDHVNNSDSLKNIPSNISIDLTSGQKHFLIIPIGWHVITNAKKNEIKKLQ